MGVIVALGFLTALPIRSRGVEPSDLGRCTAWFPLVGLMLGMVLAGLDAMLLLVWPSTVTSAVIVVALIALSGGLHLDGLMDSCDGLFGRSDPSRRMEIMRDSRVGSFGVLGAVSVLLLKYVALASLPNPWRLVALALAPTLGRWAMVLAIWGFPYARPEGLGRAFKETTSWRPALVASLIAAAAAVGLLRLNGVAILVVAAAATWLLAKFVCTRIPGLTGDIYGAVNEVVEVVCLLSVLTIAGWSNA